MRALVGLICIALVLLTGCGSTHAGDQHACASVQTPVTDIAAGANDAVQLGIPQPTGWQRSNRLDSAVIRFAMFNQSLAEKGFSPNAVVTLESLPDASGKSGQILDGQRALLQKRLKATDLNSVAGTQCGYPSETISYSAPPTGKLPARQAVVLCVVAETGAKTYLTTVTLGSVDAKNATYQQDSADILKGFQVTAVRH